MGTPPSFEFGLVIGRLIGALRSEAHVPQRVFSAELGIGPGTLGWLEVGRANAYAAQVYLVEEGLIERGVLDRHGRIFELLHAVLADLAGRGIDVVVGRVTSNKDRSAIVALDRIVGSVVQRGLDDIHRGDSQLAAEPQSRYVTRSGPVTRRSGQGMSKE